MKVPVYEKQISDAGAAKFRQNTIDTSAAQYNALRAQQYGEAQLIHGVNQFNNAIKQMTENFQQAQVADRLAEGMRRKQEIMYADGTGITHAQGSDAAGMADRAAEECKKIDEELTKGMSQWQMDRYKQTSENVNNSFIGSALKIEYGRMQEYREEKGKQLIAAGAVLYASGGTMEAQEDNIRQYCLTTGLPITEENLNKTRRQQTAAGLDMIAAKDPIAALDRYNKGDDKIFPEGDREIIRRKLEKAAKPVKAQDLSASLYESTGGNLEKMLTTIEKEYSGEEENYFKSAAKSYWRERKEFADIRAGDALDKVMELMHTGSYAATKAFVQSNKAALGDKYWQTMDAVDRYYERGKFAGSGGAGGSGGNVKLTAAQKLEFYADAKQLLESGKYDGKDGRKRFIADWSKYLYSEDLKKFVHTYFDKDGEQSDFFKLSRYVDAKKSEYGIKGDAEEELDFGESLADALRAKKKECAAKNIPFTNRDKVAVVNAQFEDVIVGHDTKFFGLSSKEVTAKRYQKTAAINEATAKGERFYTDANGNSYVIEANGTVKRWRPDKKVHKK